MDLDTNGWKIKQLLMQIGDRMKTLEWIDNADSWLCPVCRMEVSTPTKYNYHCPKCGFIAETKAAENVNGSTSSISAVCKGKRKMAYGYLWEYDFCSDGERKDEANES
jgi:rubredoxin